MALRALCGRPRVPHARALAIGAVGLEGAVVQDGGDGDADLFELASDQDGAMAFEWVALGIGR